MRKFKRVEVNSMGVVIDGGKPFRVSITDFSRMGLSFICHKQLAVRTFISVAYQTETNQIVQMQVYIKNLLPVANSNFRVGVQFVAIESRTTK